jgi:uncharacterized protein YxjI
MPPWPSKTITKQEIRMSDTTWNRYKLQKSLFALEEDFWVENEQGEQLYKADSQALSLRETFVLADKNDNELLQIEAKLLAARPTMKIKKQGQLHATVTKKLLTLLHQHYDIQVEGGPTFEAEGKINKHEYEIRNNGSVAAKISKAWFSLHDAYGIEVAPGQDDLLMLAAAICIDEISTEKS